MLEIQGLDKRYGKKHALIDFTMKFDVGVYGLLGPNGAGKSTLMNIVADVINANSGEILIDGVSRKDLGSKYREKIGYLPQNVGLYQNFTAEETLRYFGTLRNVSKAIMDERIDYCLEKVNLSKNKKDKVGSFSGGMKRRMAIAVTLVGNPDILIFDEPTVGLDPKERVRFRNLVMSIKKEKIIILSSHIVSDIDMVADEIIILKNGVVASNFKNENVDVEKIYMDLYDEED